jgi:hydroxyethylthiazole kinase-like uncharacterized protein yjeF
MEVLTTLEMEHADRLAIAGGTPGFALMLSAGQAVAQAARDLAEEGPILVVAGRGNNGGDGFVAARLLAEREFEVEILSIERSYDASTAAGRAWRAAQESPIDFVGRFKTRPMACIIDALFGTGLSRPPSGFEKQLILDMNKFDKRWVPVVAVDIPSGLDANTGRPLGIAVEATATVTMGLPKVGFQVPEARKYVGEVIVADIGFPADLLR